MIDEQNRFITDSSHELNTPLTSLKTSIEVNLRDKNFNKERAEEVLQSNLEDVNNLQFLSAELIKLHNIKIKIIIFNLRNFIFQMFSRGC